MGGSARHRHRAPRRPVRRPLAVLALVIAIVAIAVAGTLFAVSERLGDDVVRVPDPFAALDPATRPVPTAAMTFLLVGTDSRSAEPTTGEDAGQAFVPGAQRGDAALWVALRDGTPAAYARQHPDALPGPAPAGEEHP